MQNSNNGIPEKLTEISNYYNEILLPAYADLVAYLGDKPLQLLIEIENTSSHLFQAISNYDNPDVFNENCEKAINHMKRVTLDSYKLLWVEMNNYFNTFSQHTIDFCLNMSAGEFYKKRNEFKDLAREARKIEMKNVGKGTSTAIEMYRDLINTGYEIQNSVDSEKIDKFKRFNIKYFIKTQYIGIIFGLVTGLAVNFLYSFFSK